MKKEAILIIRNKNLISAGIMGKSLFDYTMDTLKTASVETVYYCGNEPKDERLTNVRSYKQLFEELSNEEGRILLIDIDYPFLCPETIVRMMEDEEDVVLADYAGITDVFALDCRNVNKLEEIIFEQIDFTDDAEKIRITDVESLAEAASFERKRINRQWLREGVRIDDPDHSYIARDVRLSPGVQIGANTEIYGDTAIGEKSFIGSGSRIENCTIGADCQIEQTRMIDAAIGDHVKIGPFAHVGPKCELGANAVIGSFVTLNNASLSENTSAGHHCSLIGMEIGKDVRLGCGVTTVDTDGLENRRIVIKDHAFIGNNVVLVEPVTVGEYAVVAAGTTLTKDVGDGDSVIGRTTRKGFGLEYIAKESKK